MNFRLMLAVVVTASAHGIASLGGIALAAGLARIGGSELLGRFTVFITLLGFFAVVARRGQSSLMIRAVSWILHTDGKAAALTLLASAIKRIVVPSILLGAVGSIVLWSEVLGRPYPGSVVALPFALLMITALSIVGGYARGSARPWLAPLFEMGGISLVTVVLLVVMLAAFKHTPAITVMIAFFAAMLLLVGVAVVLARRDLPRGTKILRSTDSQLDELRRGQIHFTLIAVASFMIQSGMFLLAAPFLSETDLGLLRGAERLALVVSFPVLAINPVIAPRIVRLARGGDATGLRRVALRVVVASSGLATCVLLPLLIWPDRALALLGTEFEAAAPYLRLMALTQFLASIIGPLAMVLNMSGREGVSMWINLGTLTLALAIVPLLCLVYGAIGFVVAYAALTMLRLGLIGMIVMLDPAIRHLPTEHRSHHTSQQP